MPRLRSIPRRRRGVSVQVGVSGGDHRCGGGARAQDGRMRLALDHVILAVPDLDQAADRLERVLGLRATRGGRHPDLGTENALVPMGGAYLELVAVTDEQ